MYTVETNYIYSYCWVYMYMYMYIDVHAYMVILVGGDLYLATDNHYYTYWVLDMHNIIIVIMLCLFRLRCL